MLSLQVLGYIAYEKKMTPEMHRYIKSPPIPPKKKAPKLCPIAGSTQLLWPLMNIAEFRGISLRNIPMFLLWLFRHFIVLRNTAFHFHMPQYFVVWHGTGTNNFCDMSIHALHSEFLTDFLQVRGPILSNHIIWFCRICYNRALLGLWGWALLGMKIFSLPFKILIAGLKMKLT